MARYRAIVEIELDSVNKESFLTRIENILGRRYTKEFTSRNAKVKVTNIDRIDRDDRE